MKNFNFSFRPCLKNTQNGQTNLSGMNTKNTKGITLVALVVTIVVLLILAGITITMLFGENGIIKKAQDAADATKNAQEQTMQGLQNLANELANALGENGGSSGGGSSSAKWTKDAEGNIKSPDGKTVLHVGDYINYSSTPTKEGAVTSYTSYAQANASSDKNDGRTSGYTADQTFTASAYTGEWRVLGVNEKGELEIMANTNVPVAGGDSGKYYYLKGKKGYTDGIKEIEEISKIYGQGNGATGARAITVEDINNITGYDPENPANGAVAKYGVGNIYEYGNEVTYSRPTASTVSCSGTNGVSGTGNYNKYEYYNGSEWISLGENDGSNRTEKSTYYYYYPNTYTRSSSGTTVGIETTSAESKTLFGNSSSEYYWLGSSYVATNPGYISFGMRSVSGGIVDGYDLYYSRGSEIDTGCGVRPVVSLKSDIQLEKGAQKDGCNSYTIVVE